jgi:hypothetical protein
MIRTYSAGIDDCRRPVARMQHSVTGQQALRSGAFERRKLGNRPDMCVNPRPDPLPAGTIPNFVHLDDMKITISRARHDSQCNIRVPIDV